MPAPIRPAGAAVPASHPLHEGWSLRAVAGPVPESLAAQLSGAGVPATVPGSSHTDLLDAGLIPDPYLDLNETALAWMHRVDWRYTTDFDAPPVADGERVDLVFDGLDTVATVRLNGAVVARTVNQHRTYRVDVREHLAEHNDLVVDLASAVEHAEVLEAEHGHRPRPYQHPFVYVRKMACSFGWDWGPDLQTAGIWKPVRLERWRTARLAQVRPLVTVDDTDLGRVEVHVEVERAGSGPGDTDVPLTVNAAIGGSKASVVVPAGATSGTVTVLVPRAERWWPVGHGAPRLYDLVVTLTGPDDVVLGTWERRVGFREVRVERTPDEHGTPFTFVVNGRPVFVKGANWIPDDHLLTRIDRARLERRMDQALGAGMNLLRVWGGGIYETEDFYDAADERGLMVWQDFLFACGAYPEEEPFWSEVEAEVRENVVRLAPHASLVLWNGANENIWAFADWGWPALLEGRTWGLRYYTELLPAIVAELDPTRPYSDNSPYSPVGPDGAQRHPNDPDHGTHHEWECWNRCDYVHYRDAVPRFCSEFGWQGPATWATLTRAVPPEALRQESASFLQHQKAEDGNDKLNRGLAPHLPVPEDFEDWHWATSLLQARAVRFAVEHYRSWWPRTAGSIVWQLNDCWPVTSWAAIDGDERPKPLWFALRDAYADRIVTVQPRDGRATAVLVNDTDTAWTTSLLARRTTLDGAVLARAAAPSVVPPRAVLEVPLPDDVLTPAEPSAEVLVLRTGDRDDDGGGESRTVHGWVEDKDLRLVPAPFATSVTRTGDGYRVDVTARSLVRDLTLLADKLAPDARVDRQLVTLLAGETSSLVVRTDAVLDETALVDPRVLRSANDLHR